MNIKLTCQRPTWRGTSGVVGNHPGTANTCCKTFRGARCHWHRRCKELWNRKIYQLLRSARNLALVAGGVRILAEVKSLNKNIVPT